MARWMLTFVISCLCGIAAVYLALWAFGGFHDLGLSLQGIVALTIGTTISVALGVGLMALVFYSDRSGRDEHVSDVKGSSR